MSAPVAGRARALGSEATVAVVGCGAMGSAIASGIVAGGVVEPGSLWLCDADDAKATALADELGAHVASGPHAADVILLCVKPQVLAAVARSWAQAASGRLVISIAAGVDLATLEGLLPESRVVRVMPNLPVAKRSGASAVCPGALATGADTEVALALFGALGAAATMTEAQLDVAGALSGCGPAYLALFVDAFTRPAIENGLPASVARDFLVATFKGTAEMLRDGVHPRAYMEQVMSPGGTTVQAVSAMEPLLMDGAERAVSAALERTRQLAEGD